MEVIQRGSEYLARREVDSPRLQMELMLAKVLGLPRLKLYLEFDRVMTPQQTDELREMVRRRGEREPLQHILGTVSFCGLELGVNRDVLVPRPETELLAERAWTFMESVGRRPGGEAPRVLDLGTGSGCLAIALAKRFPGACVHAVDISTKAVAVARENAARHGVAITFHEGDYTQGLASALPFDLVVSNPPYIPSGELAKLQAEVRDFDPPLALDGGTDGLDHYRRLAGEVPARMRPGGRLLLELGFGQARAVEEILRVKGWRIESVDKDYAGVERILVAGREKD